MKKILFVASVAGHINAFHIPYINLFKDKGYEVHIATKNVEKIKDTNFKYEINFSRQPFKISNFKSYKDLKRIIKENNYEIIHCHTPVVSVLTRLAARNARKKGTKVFYTAHGFHFYKGAPFLNWIIYYPIEKIMSRYTDCLITITKEDYEFAKKHFKKAKRIEHINGIGMNKERFDIDISEEEKEELVKQLNINKDEIVLSYVAELNKNKNQILLINVVENLVKNGRNVKLLLIGDGNLKQEYIRIIKEKDLSNNILVLGKRKDVPQLLSITNIYVASSIREGLPVNVMEAMYMGLPIVATDNRGHRELIENNGFLIKGNKNYKEFYEKIFILMNDKKLYDEFKENSRILSKKYIVEKVIEKMKNIYKGK